MAEVFGSRFAFGPDIYADQAGELLAVEALQNGPAQREEGTVNMYSLILHVLKHYGEIRKVTPPPHTHYPRSFALDHSLPHALLIQVVLWRVL